jgi:hypothetical protein
MAAKTENAFFESHKYHLKQKTLLVSSLEWPRQDDFVCPFFFIFQSRRLLISSCITNRGTILFLFN